MPLPKFSLQFAFSWSVYFSNRTESYSSQIEFAGPHGIICNFTFSYLILSKTIGRKRLRTQSLVGADLGQLVLIYTATNLTALHIKKPKYQGLLRTRGVNENDRTARAHSSFISSGQNLAWCPSRKASSNCQTRTMKISLPFTGNH